MKINQLKAGVLLSYISMILGYAISIIYTPVMLRILGQNEYGLYSLVSSIVAYLGLLNFGMGGAYNRYYSIYKVKNDEKNIAKLNAIYLVVFSIMALIAFFTGIICSLNLEYILGGQFSSAEAAKSKILFFILVINIAVSFMTTVFNTHIIANEKYIYQKFIQMIRTIVSPFVMLPILLLGYGSIGMVVSTLILNTIIEISNIIFCIKKLKIKFLFKKFDFGLVKEILIFSSYLFANMIIDQINWNVDKFIIGRYRGAAEVAVYGIAAQLNGYYLSVSTVISSVFIPRVNKMVADKNDNKELSDLFIRIGRIQFIMLSFICSSLVFFGQVFINLWAGAEYNNSYYIMLLLVVSVTIPLIQNIGIEIQKAKNMHKFRSLVYLLMAVGNICISIPLTKLYGGIGAAVGTAIALTIGNGLIMNIYYHKRIGLNMRLFWKQIIKFALSIIPVMIFGIVIYSFVNLYNIFNFIIFFVLYTIVFAWSMWFLGMNQDEKNIVKIPMLKIYAKIRKVK